MSSIPKTIWENVQRDVIQDWGGSTVDDVYDLLAEDYPDYRERQRFEKMFISEVDQYINKAVENLSEEQLLSYLQEPDVWRQVLWTQLGAFTEDLSIELEDWLRQYIKVEVDYQG